MESGTMLFAIDCSTEMIMNSSKPLLYWWVLWDKWHHRLYAFLDWNIQCKEYNVHSYDYGQFPLNNDPELQTSDPNFISVKSVRVKGALIWLQTSLKGDDTLYVCSIWMWEAITCNPQSQPWHHGNASFPLDYWPKIPKIWTNFAGVIVL
jgi:hypothetical protein